MSMSEYGITQVYPTDQRLMAGVEELLVAEGTTRDGNLDYTCAILDELGHPIATGSCYGNTLRCFAVSSAHQGEGLPKADIDCIVVPRKEADSKSISASTVRQCLQTGDWDTLSHLVPQTTLDYFRSAEAAPIIERIRKAGDVVHY